MYVVHNVCVHTRGSLQVVTFSATQAALGSAAAVGGDVEESGCGTDTDPIIIIDSEEEEEEEVEEEKEEIEEEREEEEEEGEKEEEDDFVVKVDLSDDDVSQGEGGREGREEVVGGMCVDLYLFYFIGKWR